MWIRRGGVWNGCMYLPIGIIIQKSVAPQPKWVVGEVIGNGEGGYQ